MEKDVQKVFVKINQVWQKGEIVSKDGTTLKVKTSENMEFNIDESSQYVEQIKNPAQKFAYGDAKEKLEGAYISFNKLPNNVQDAIVKGEEYMHSSSYVHEGELKENVRAVQLMYNRQTGSKLDVQIKRNEPVKLAEAIAYNYQFTKEEFDLMVKQGKQVVFQGSSKDGEVFSKLAYYEPKLNDIRTKSALSENNYFYGQKLTKEQATIMNKGESAQITINTKKGEKTYMVNYSPKSARFITKTFEKENVNDLKVQSMVDNQKKKIKPQKGIAH
tara:strand:+ start:14353 stop:15174 length:822 start_codon:yes stop_codon:yes gene_type:complete